LPLFFGWILGAIFTLALIFRKTILLKVGVVLFFVCLGSAYVQNWRENRFATFITETPVSFEGLIVEPPDTRKDKTFLTIKPLTQGLMLSGNKDGLLQITAQPYPVWKYGDIVKVEGTITKPEAFDGFDYPRYLERHGIYGQVRQPRKLEKSGEERGSAFYSLLYQWRFGLEKTIQGAIPEPEGSFLEGLLLGSRKAIPEHVTEALKHTGTSHIIAISGANITISLGLVLAFLPLYQPRHQFWMVVALGGFITLLTGASSSVIRGAAVAGMGRYLRLKSRRVLPASLLMISMTAMTLYNPLLLTSDPGFQLSFAAFAGLLYAATGLKRLLEKVSFLKSWPEALKAPLAETGAATVATAPLSLGMFGQVSLLGLIVNPLILWVLTPITIGGYFFLAVAKLPLISSFMQFVVWIPLHFILDIVTLFSRIPFGIIHYET
jgi:competence protein ComEC